MLHVPVLCVSALAQACSCWALIVRAFVCCCSIDPGCIYLDFIDTDDIFIKFCKMQTENSVNELCRVLLYHLFSYIYYPSELLFDIFH